MSIKPTFANRLDEPQVAAWDEYGGGYGSHLSNDIVCANQACVNVKRNNDDEHMEHLAAPGCTQPYGYAGFRISAEEMKGCNHIQCLAVKEADWVPEPGDEDFDVEAERCFLTDLMWAMPMHPWCFEIFKRVSVRELDKVDIDGLWILRLTQATEEGFKGLDRGWDVRLVSDSTMYEPVPGTEYLAANPLSIPALPAIDPTHPAGDLVFDALQPRSCALTHTDSFATLPTELRLMILTLLSPTSISFLRLASRSFVQLPRSLFRHLLQTHMPWLWEFPSLHGKPMDWYALYRAVRVADGSTTNAPFYAAEQISSSIRIHEAFARAERRIWESSNSNNKKNGDDNDSDNDNDNNDNNNNGNGGDAAVLPFPAAAFVRLKVDRVEGENEQWRVEWGMEGKVREVKGLRNRRRIWRDVEVIVRRIRGLDRRGVKEEEKGVEGGSS
ncbi:hypothetical protein LTR28_002267 [Elasticomyces elasticus]|nr:hypothetical protein LTR28_002267 [Elasticomyces elasticus]